MTEVIFVEMKLKATDLIWEEDEMRRNQSPRGQFKDKESLNRIAFCKSKREIKINVIQVSDATRR